jgi:integrating conjugative element protein (TIGR03746 family)
MGAFKKLDQKDKTIKLLVIIIALLGILLMHAHVRVVNTPKEMTCHMPPDIRTGGAMKIGVAYDITAYDFVFTMFSSVNTWSSDGSKEYKLKLQQYKNYFSNDYIKTLERKADRDIQANKGRTRVVEYVQDKYQVKSLGGNRFEVELVVHIVDKIRDHIIKDEFVKYYFYVTPSNVIRSKNPWQLKIQGEYAPSERL